MIVGRRVRDRRIELGLSQRELAAKLGYQNHSAVARVENGQVDLPQSRIAQFAKALNVTPAYLMGWDEEPEELGAVAADVLRDRDLLRLVQNYMTMSDADRATVCALVESLARKKKG